MILKKILIDQRSESRSRACADMTEQGRSSKGLILRGVPRNRVEDARFRACPNVLIPFISLTVAFSVLILCGGFAAGVNSDLSDNLIRLHVIANSDSPSDQELKLKVRDAVIATAAPFVSDLTDKDSSSAALMEHSADIIRAARQVIEQNGYDYDVSLSYGKYFFPVKRYANVVLPSGEYDALRIVIGEGEGKNWWCVMFPPLCLVNEGVLALDDKSLQFLKDNLTPEEYDIITSNEDSSLPIIMKFKIVEWCMDLKQFLKG